MGGKQEVPNISMTPVVDTGDNKEERTLERGIHVSKEL